MELEEAKKFLKHVVESQKHLESSKNTKFYKNENEAIETVLKGFEELQSNSIPKKVIEDRILYRKFELQQEYKDFETDIELQVLQDLLKGEKDVK